MTISELRSPRSGQAAALRWPFTMQNMRMLQNMEEDGWNLCAFEYFTVIGWKLAGSRVREVVVFFKSMLELSESMSDRELLILRKG